MSICSQEKCIYNKYLDNMVLKFKWQPISVNVKTIRIEQTPGVSQTQMSMSI